MENIKNNKLTIISFAILFVGIIIMFEATVAYLTITGCSMILISSILLIVCYNRIKKTGGKGKDLLIFLTIMTILIVIFWGSAEVVLSMMKMDQ